MRNTWWDVEAYDRLCHKQVDARQVPRLTRGSGNLTRWILIWTKLGLHRTPRSPCRRSTLGWPHRDCARVAKIVFEGQRLEPLEPNLGIFAFSTQPLPQHVYTLYFSISRILPKSRGHIYRFLQLVLAPCPPDRPDPAPPSLVGHPAGQRLGARDAKSGRYWRYISAIFFSWC